MARLRTIDPQDVDTELREVLGEELLAQAEQMSVFGIWAQRPDLLAPFVRFQQALRQGSALSPRLVELVRLRVAFHNQCRSCMARRDGAAFGEEDSEALVCQLDRPEDAADLTDQERAALRYADQLATDHLSITDGTFDNLRAHFSEPEIVELGVQIAGFVGFGRVAMSWDMVDALPERFRRRDVVITPWEPGTGTADL
jgi:AhpD family alkylhydroperoxidase